MALCFMAFGEVHTLEFAYDLSALTGQQLTAPLAICSQFQLVRSVFCHGVVYFRATCTFSV
jgi:hypothetical protein